MATIAEANLLDSKDFVRLYRDHLSDFRTWEQRKHAEKWLVFPKNIGDDLSLDEVEVSDGELYTVLTNKERHGRKGSLVAIVQGTKVEVVCAALLKIPLKQRSSVRTITHDLDDSMAQISITCFPHAERIDDRFHVQQLVSDALQEIRIHLRKEAINDHNKKTKEARERGGNYWAPRYENGDTAKELLARGRYLLFKSSGSWSPSQRERAKILFREFPLLEEAYKLSMQFRGFYEYGADMNNARKRLHKWYNSVEKRLEKFPSFETPMQTIKMHEETILHYFNSWKTNASAESFNAKIKNFRALQRGVSGVPFFLFRLSKLYA